MVNMNGQKYTCSLPKNPNLVPDGNKTEDEPEVDIEELLSPLESAPCMFLTKDWWTYEVCYKRYCTTYIQYSSLLVAVQGYQAVPYGG